MSITRGCFAFPKSKLLLLPSSTRLAITRYKSKSVVREVHDPNKPIKFSASQAWNLPQVDSSTDNTPWYKIIILSVTAISFVVYLVYFREGNDIDEDLDMPLGKRYLWVQEQHLLAQKRDLISSGHDGSSVDAELKKIQELRKKYGYD